MNTILCPKCNGHGTIPKPPGLDSQSGGHVCGICNSKGIIRVVDDLCSGFRSPDKCPHTGVYVQHSKACIECTEDAISAMEE